jgi:UDP-glucose 4-epimerase
MRVLLTGASGRVGRAIYVRLTRSHTVIGLDAAPSSTADFVGDIADSSLLDQAVDGVDVIVHAAALHAPHVGRANDAAFVRVNVEATRRLAELAAQRGTQRFVFTSTTALFGEAATPTDCAGWITEESTPIPRTVYHRTKLQAEEALREVSSRTGMPVTILRMSRCFPEPVDTMAVYRLHRGIDARDVAAGHEAAIAADKPGVSTYILSGATPFLPEDTTALKLDAASVLRRRCPQLVASIARRGWTLPRTIDRVYDATRAREELGWASRFGFDEVLRQYDAESSEVLSPGSGVREDE